MNSENMFSDYKHEVLRSYELKRNLGTLSSDLTHPSPGKIKRQCRVIFETRPAKNDMKILSDFFGHQANETEYLKSIKSFDVDKFKPVANFLKGDVKNPDERIIELVAWLIDFSPRPFKFGFAPEGTKTDGELPGGNLSEGLRDEELKNTLGGAGKLTLNQQPPKTKSPAHRFLAFRRPLFWAISLFVIAGIGISVKRPNTMNSLFSASTGCMYWTGENYTAIACDRDVSDTLVIGLNENKLDNFRKIVDLASISENDIGKVWYYKIRRDEIECYTGSGRHPVFPGKDLKPLTKYMYGKYILPLKK